MASDTCTLRLNPVQGDKALRESEAVVKLYKELNEMDEGTDKQEALLRLKERLQQLTELPITAVMLPGVARACVVEPSAVELGGDGTALDRREQLEVGEAASAAVLSAGSHTLGGPPPPPASLKR